MAKIGVVHLVRAGNGTRPLRDFLHSYAENPGGIEHDLIIIFKGFSDDSEELRDCRRELVGFRYLEIHVDDSGYDIGAYFKAHQSFDHDYFCFLNSYSVLLDKEWLQKMYRHIASNGVGLVGATGSYQSLYSGKLRSFLKKKLGRKGLLRLLGSSAPAVARKIERAMKPYRFFFDRFPNAHIRTNAFMISREVMGRMDRPVIRAKMDAYRMESGTNGMTKQVLRMGGEPLVVGKDGKGYRIEDWPDSNTFCAGKMENLLVADNMTRAYSDGDDEKKEFLRRHAWMSPLRWNNFGRDEVERRCPLCTRKRSSRAFRAKDYNRKTSQQIFDYFRCRSCGYIRLFAIPDNLGDYYGEDYYQIPSSLDEWIPAAEKHEGYKVDLIRQFVTGGKLLEIGPAIGGALYLAKRAGYEVEAIEMDGRCCRFLRDTMGIEAIQSDNAAEVLNASNKHYDVITAWHVIEHLSNYVEILEAAAEKLAPGGILVIAAPNPDSLQARLFRRFWTHLDAPRHVALIPLPLLKLQALALGLQPELSTTTDPGGRMWNTFGWRHSWKNLMSRFLGKEVSPKKFEKFCDVVFRPLEVTGDMGSAYTAVFRKKKQ